MHERDAHKSAFITHIGLFEWLVLPMGLSNSPANLQSYMSTIKLVYLKDIISVGKDFDYIRMGLRALFDRLQHANLSLKSKKFKLFRHKVAYVGHVVSPTGIRSYPSKIEAI